MHAVRDDLDRHVVQPIGGLDDPGIPESVAADDRRGAGIEVRHMRIAVAERLDRLLEQRVGMGYRR